jgi:predicted RNase H-like nuclease
MAVVRHLSNYLDDHPEVNRVGIDMPIGLSHNGDRACDRDARRRLGRRGVTVFPMPPRALLSCSSYSEANATSSAMFGRGLQKQVWFLFDKIKELDNLVGHRRENFFAEIHPEVTWATLTGEVLPPKRTPEGLRRRIDAIAALWPDIERCLTNRPTDCARDDVLDAAAVLWSTQRFERGEAVVLGDGARDELGRLMQIVT